MALAAYLLLAGIKYDRIEVSGGNGRTTAECVFHSDARLTELSEEYALGEAFVEPLDFQRKVAFVRNRMKDSVRDFESQSR